MTCSHDPREQAPCPSGMYHCPECGDMVLAGVSHPPADPFEDPQLVALCEEHDRLLEAGVIDH